jgi:hypothetical protein
MTRKKGSAKVRIDNLRKCSDVNGVKRQKRNHAQPGKWNGQSFEAFAFLHLWNFSQDAPGPFSVEKKNTNSRISGDRQHGLHGNTAVTMWFLEALWMNSKKQMLFSLCSIFNVVCDLRWLFEAWLECDVQTDGELLCRKNSSYNLKKDSSRVSSLSPHWIRFCPGWVM